MAQIRHPNLVLFVAAVLSEQTGPMIVTELLDTSLRTAYEDKHIGANKRKIFEDVSLALVYLHGQREPIIHRDVSSANVLLISQPNDTWLAKLSDFGSANLARYATTPGEGAIVYTAPEAYPGSGFNTKLYTIAASYTATKSTTMTNVFCAFRGGLYDAAIVYNWGERSEPLPSQLNVNFVCM